VGIEVIPDPLKQWIGHTETRSETIGATPVLGFNAMLDHRDPVAALGGPIPPLAQRLFFNLAVPNSEMGDVGHPKRGGFRPPADLPRRMRAGSRLDFERPLLAGDQATRRSTITGAQIKNGSSGPLVFVAVQPTTEVGGFGPLKAETGVRFPWGAPASSSPAPPHDFSGLPTIFCDRARWRVASGFQGAKFALAADWCRSGLPPRADFLKAIMSFGSWGISGLAHRDSQAQRLRNALTPTGATGGAGRKFFMMTRFL
jgi:hypothetical protein